MTAVWEAVHVPLLDPTSWTQAERLAGLSELERIVREAHAAMAAVIAGMAETRDKTTAIARACGVSAGEALQRRKVAAVCDKFRRAGDLLARGALSPEHLAPLERVLSLEGAERLLDSAVVQSPEEFKAIVESFRLASEHGDNTAKRQRAQRYLRFGDGPDGMVALRGLLPPVEGKNLQTVLRTLVNAKWRKDHPERARTAGGHGGDTHEQRLADALLDVAGVRPFYDVPADRSGAADDWNSDRPESCVEEDVCEGGSNEWSSDDGDAGGGDVEVGDAHEGVATDPGVRAGTVVNTGNPAVIIVFNVDRWQATLIGQGPIPVTESLFDQTRSELYYLFENMEGEILKFGRARRDPTPLQRLAIIARDQRCIYPDCNVWADRCQIHHINEVHLDHGETDVDKMGLLCGPHHPHTHENELVLERKPYGIVDVLRRDSGEVVQPGRRRAASAQRVA